VIPLEEAVQETMVGAIQLHVGDQKRPRTEVPGGTDAEPEELAVQQVVSAVQAVVLYGRGVIEV
jgi:hypothetical protein